MPRTLSLLLALALAAPAAHAHGPTRVVLAAPAGFAPPTVAAVDDAIADAAVDFDVPTELLQVMAYVESRYAFDPARVSADGRVGLFGISPGRAAIAAEFLRVPLDALRTDLATHTRAMAFLLATVAPPRPVTKRGDWNLLAWRDAIAWATDLHPDVADLYVDHLYERLDSGVIDRLPDGQPVAIAPLPVQPGAIGGFSEALRTGPGADYPGVVYNTAPSCNHTPASRGLSDVDYVVVHTTQGSYAGAISWFLNCASSVSAHYVIRASDGQITQTLDEEDVGWHAGNWSYNQASIGIEHEGYVSNATWVTTPMLNASAALTADILADYNLPATRSVVIGHNEVPGATHTDPGQYWPWTTYMDLITGGSSTPTATLVGYIRHTDLFDAQYGIAGATVTVDGGVGTFTTNSSGYYSIDPITPGSYTVCAVAAGFDEACDTKTVQAGTTNWKSILLTAAAPGDDDDDDDDDSTPAADDDDSTPAGDDDDSTPAADDDDSGPLDASPSVGGERRSSFAPTSDVRACAQGGGASPLPLALLLLALPRRRTR